MPVQDGEKVGRCENAQRARALISALFGCYFALFQRKKVRDAFNYRVFQDNVGNRVCSRNLVPSFYLKINYQLVNFLMKFDFFEMISYTLVTTLSIFYFFDIAPLNVKQNSFIDNYVNKDYNDSTILATKVHFVMIMRFRIAKLI